MGEEPRMESLGCHRSIFAMMGRNISRNAREATQMPLVVAIPPSTLNEIRVSAPPSVRVNANNASVPVRSCPTKRAEESAIRIRGGTSGKSKRCMFFTGYGG